jgi:hypothetical protein
MSEDQGLRYENYTAKSLAVFGDRDRYDGIMKTIGARWNDKMRRGAGWMLNREHEDKLKQLIASLGQTEGSEPVSLTKLKGKKGNTKTQADVVPTEVTTGKRGKKGNVDTIPQPITVPAEPVVKRKYTKKVKGTVSEVVSEVVSEPVPEHQDEPPHEQEHEPIIAPESISSDISSEDKAEEVSDNISESSISDSNSTSDVSDYEGGDQDDDSQSYVSSESEYDPRAAKHTNHHDEKIDHRKIVNPNEKLHKKSKETFINQYVNSDDEVDPEESRKILEKYQKLFQFFKSFSEKPERFDHEKVRRMRD